jgi:hypothetical protein
MHNAITSLMASLMVVAACHHPSQLDDPELVGSLRFSPSAFDSFKSNTEIRYNLKVPATLDVFIIVRDSTGKEYLVKTIATNAAESKGSHAHTWLGDTNNQLFAPPGLYIGVIQIEHRRFEATVLVFHY